MNAGVDLTGKVALVTGAGMGMGLATAQVLAAAGAAVLLADRDEQACLAAAGELREAGFDAHGVVADVSVESDVQAMVGAAVERWGRLDCAVNNAGVLPDPARIEDFDVSEFDRIISVNLKGVLLCLKYEIRQMRAQGGGAIVNIGSIRSVRAQVGAAIYTAAKHGVVGVTKTAALENALHGIRVNVVLPGGIETPMVRAGLRRTGESAADLAARLSAIGRLGDPAEVGRTSAWLCSDAASYITGQQLAVDGGYLVM